MKTITVTIPHEKFSTEKYDDSRGCYLTMALKAEGYEDFLVGPRGKVFLEQGTFYPTKPFNHKTVKEAFDKGESITIELVDELTDEIREHLKLRNLDTY